jgi:hypothetical protein
MKYIKHEEYIDKNNKTMYYYKLTIRYVSFCEHLLKKYKEDERYYQYKLEVILKALFLFRLRTGLINKNQDTSLCSNIMEEQAEYYRLGVLQDNKEEKLDACYDIIVFILNTVKKYDKDYEPSMFKEVWESLPGIAYQIDHAYDNIYFRNYGDDYQIPTLSSIISRYVCSDKEPMKLHYYKKIDFIANVLFRSYIIMGTDNPNDVISNLMETVKVVIYRYGEWNEQIGKFVKYKSMDIDNVNSVIDYVKHIDKEQNDYNVIKCGMIDNRYFYKYVSVHNDDYVYIPKMYKPKYIFN